MRFPPHHNGRIARHVQWLAVAIPVACCACTDPEPNSADVAGTALFDSDPTSIDSSAVPDLPTLDVATKPEVAVAALDCPGDPGCACVAHAECQTGLCIDDPNNSSGKACARKCVDVCPIGYSCAPVTGSSGDISTICVPKFGHLCDPCAASKDCEALGLKDSACVDKAAAGKFCGIGCATQADCPGDYDCQSVATAEGGSLKQCVRNSSDCACSAAAAQKKLATACYTEFKDDGGKVVGKCAGVRTCEVAGLSACTAPAGQVEVCNGKDDDCDGLTDEGSCDDKKPCTDDSCDGAGGCSNVAKPSMACDADGSLCTEGDACVDGMCKAGKTKDCDDKNPCTADSCDAAKGCTQTADDGKPCDADGNLCTQGDICQGGTCKAGTAALCNDDNPCTTDGCDKKSGQCTASSQDDGVPCDDGTACTEKDVCKNSTCKGKAVACDDNNPCTLDVCNSKLGCQLNKLSGAPCDDDNLCTLGDQCSDGDCQAGKAKTCASLDACYVGKCSLVDGKCKITEAVFGTACDDGSACTSNDACASGNCAGAVKVCDDGNPCTDDGCTAKLGCITTAAIKACDDANACTGPDSCKGGACVGLATAGSVACDDANPCTGDSCDPKAGCVHSPVSGACDDGNSCTQGDICQAGACAPGTSTCACQADVDCVAQDDGDLCNGSLYCDKAKVPYLCKIKAATVVVCDASQNGPCLSTVCSPKSGACGKVAAVDGKACEADGTACTANDSCKQGACSAGSPLACDDSNPCTTDACDPKLGCVAVANSQNCDADGDACTVGDVCNGKLCLAGSKKVCDDGEVCTADSCLAANGKCVFAFKPQDGAACDADGSVCTEGDTCNGGLCLVGKAKLCNDGNLCSDDSCDAKLGCKAGANTKVCDDGNACTTSDVCGQLACAGQAVNAPVFCSDTNPCTSDSCDAKVGCLHAANKAQCDDGNPCTVGDICVSSACTAGTNTCGCESDSDCTPQEDGDLCNGTLFCDKGKLPYQCKVNPKSIVACDISKDSACLATACTAKTGACDKVAAANGKACDADGSVCTDSDVCKNGGCGPGASKACDDANVCTDDGCDAKLGCTQVPNAASCSDGNACTVGDKCAFGDCESKPAKCNDSNGCTDDGCDVKTGCKAVPNTAVCDDGSACTSGDVCATGTCSGGKIKCDDGNGCTDDSCDPTKGCVYLPNTVTCSDGNVCTVGDKCAATVCKGGALLDGDGDGFVAASCGGTDCNDGSAAINPGKNEACGNAVDDSCNGQTDENCGCVDGTEEVVVSVAAGTKTVCSYLWPLWGYLAVSRPASEFAVSGDKATVADSKTGLVWQRSPPTSGGVSNNGTYSFADAIKYCDGLTLGGQDDWRAPSRVELETIADWERSDPAVDFNVFVAPLTGTQAYWTRTAYQSSASGAWGVNFGNGDSGYFDFTNNNRVRCVR